MFRGINAINIDPKGRVAVPTRYRDLLLAHAATVILTIDTESPCLLLYPTEEWEQIERKVAELPSFNPTARRIQRLLIGHATELEIDNAGRLLIPPLLREYANLTKRVMLVGQRNKFELWDESAWLRGREAWINEEAPLPLDSLDSLRDLTL